MIQAATYSNGHQSLAVSVDKIEVLVHSLETLNFPRIIPLEGDRLVVPYWHGRHQGNERQRAIMSDDGGKTWSDLPADSPLADNVQTRGIMGDLRDGTMLYVDHMPLEIGRWGWDKPVYHRTAFIPTPTFRMRHFSRAGAPAGDLLETMTTRVVNMPWPAASYENYGSILELDNGDLLTAFQCHIPPIDEKRFNFTTFIARSSDRGKTFEYVWTFSPYEDGKSIGDQGLCEPDMALLANGDILIMLRTGHYSPMYQARSTDGGLTWSKTASIGWPGVKPVLRLLRNGVLACSAGRGSYGHPQVTYAMFSIDGTGEVWEYPFAFHTGPGCSYTSNVERDNKFYVAYSDSSFNREPSIYKDPNQYIKLARLSVTKTG